MRKIIIIDFGMGNIISLKNIFDYLGCKTIISSNYQDIKNFSHIILPGVGSFKKAMENLKSLNLNEEILEHITIKEKKILGICLGMQLLGSSSTENGFSEGLNLISNKVVKFDDLKFEKLKFPHVGFNNIKIRNNNSNFLDKINDMDNFYFNHNYFMTIGNIKEDYATCDYGDTFISAFKKNNLFGVQFHPEKSQSSGIKFLSNFLA
ncbi:imidazole glycerol phosphate synthase subunit HisH [Candidatus Pelagibacter ubique]|jgi:imidazole glycerol-phosphate synthase subunit HisH|nr:imidazole glycerol phosphate synthase subunit HisH [Candidatus Pelagibacter ubique]